MLTTIAWTYCFFSLHELVLSMTGVWNASRSGRLKRTAKAFVDTVIGCPRCFAFWLGLLLTFSVVPAALASMAMHLYDNITSR